MMKSRSLFLGLVLSRYARASFIARPAGSTAGCCWSRPLFLGTKLHSATTTSRLHLSANPRVSISDSFDGGNIEFLDIVVNEDGSLQVKLNVKKDVYTELEKTSHSQYFAFRSMVNSGDETKITYSLENAADVSYPAAWVGATVFYTNNMGDTNSWRRNLDTSYSEESGKLTWTHEHKKSGPVYFSYFPPYTYNQHLELVSRSAEYATVNSLGMTLDGRDIDCVSVGNGERVCWIIHRQHPGEHMAEYFAEGLLTRLLGLDTAGEVDGLVKDCLKKYTFYIVPSVNPDGGVRGHLRVNAGGANLNREWANSGDYQAPSPERSPEVHAILTQMDATGVDAFIDVHGDEELPFNFLAGSEQTKNWGKRLESLHGAFVAAYQRANSDMQKSIGYDPPPADEEAKANIGTNAVADRFDCLSVTLEMPFKDCLSNPDPERGWSPNRARKLGASLLDAVAYVQPYLRNTSEFWKDLPEDDAYVVPTSEYSH